MPPQPPRQKNHPVAVCWWAMQEHTQNFNLNHARHRRVALHPAHSRRRAIDFVRSGGVGVACGRPVHSQTPSTPGLRPPLFPF